MNKSLLRNLVQKYLAETLSAEELDQLRYLLAEDDSELILDQEFSDLFKTQMRQEYVLPEIDHRIRQYVMDHLRDDREKSNSNDVYRTVRGMYFLSRWGWVAASVVLVMAAGAYFWKANEKDTLQTTVSVSAADIAPGRDGAILTLADGTQVVLDSLGNGVVASQKGAQVLLKSRQLTYSPTGETTDEASFNTMTTPKGRQFEIKLPDGTKAWLNSASSIRFPTAFIGKERIVYITGEVYFEVAKNFNMPFKAIINETSSVEVLGTHFNVNAYLNENSVNTTLLEGAVRVSYSGKTQSLLPGQQARLSNQNIVVDQSPDLEQIMGWKKGLFIFNNDDVYTVIRQLERWYDIDVRFENDIPKKQFNGKVQRNLQLSQILKVLEGVGIQFRMEGERRLVVYP
ncbi:MAG: DUF4974 domain-containing protein [Chitinophagaceae bacterium]|nr:DUF4974 domain-containing protein [Chitinophagaceae bacterium]